MSAVRFYDLWMLHLLWLPLIFLAVHYYGAIQAKAAAERFASSHLYAPLANSVSQVRRRWKTALFFMAVSMIAVALARPAWNPVTDNVKRQGRDVVFLLDVSRSMLADDLAPNRLERAKLAIMDCVEQLQGDRVGLVAFAGSAVVMCPLTLDYGFFRMQLSELSPDSVPRGGTLIGDALRKATKEVFDAQNTEFRDVILITDGEDQESFPVEAAKEAGARGIRLIAIGLGDETQGRRIPTMDEKGNKVFLQHEGQEVWTKLDASTLREMAVQTHDGRYLNVATGAFDLGRIYMDFIASASKRELEDQVITRYEEKFQLFLLAAFMLLGAGHVLNDARRSMEDAS